MYIRARAGTDVGADTTGGHEEANKKEVEEAWDVLWSKLRDGGWTELPLPSSASTVVAEAVGGPEERPSGIFLRPGECVQP